MVSSLRHDWARKWMQIRLEYLANIVPEYAVEPIENSMDLWLWECLGCGAQSEIDMTMDEAARAASVHVHSHVSEQDREVLEDMKVTMMPPELLTPSERARKRMVQERKQ